MAESKTRDIRDALIEVIEPLELIGPDGPEKAFTEVAGHTRGLFKKWPSVRVLPVDINPEKAAYRQSDRVVAFIARTYLPFKEDGSDFDNMYPLVDLLVDALEEADANNSLQGSFGIYQMSVTRGEWLDVETPTGVVLSADVNIEVTYSHNM